MSRPKTTHIEFSVLDLFCGAGGLSSGFEEAGFRLQMSVDNNKAALATYRHNFKDTVLESDLSLVSDFVGELPQSTVIIGGPPCQGFSSAGLRRQGDARNTLVSSFAHAVCHLMPSAFVFENVEGFLTHENGYHIFELLEPLIQVGYRIHLRKINSANYGVPQHRKRVVAIGGLGWNPQFPMPTHTAFGAPGAGLVTREHPLTPTIDEALEGLPVATQMPPGDIQGHYYRPPIGLDLERAVALKPGQKMADLPEHLQHESYRRRAFRRVQDGTPSDRRGGAPTGIRRLVGNEPSKAITGGARAEFFHPHEHRPLTLRECARLQTFPDHFIFCGNQAEQMQLIGNAVPPRLAHAIATSLAFDLKHNVSDCSKEGALLSFVPTFSEGYSPVLRRVTDDVTNRFMKRPTLACHEELILWT